MKTKLKGLDILHSEEELKVIETLDNNSPFSIHVTALLGPSEGEGAEFFDVFVCNPAYLEQELKTDSYVWGRHMLVVSKFDINLIERAVKDKISEFDEPTWDQLGEKLNRYFAWEFEDYKEE